MHNITDAQEVPIIFECRNEKLIGVVHLTENIAKTGVLLVVGGPQYRVGSHRQFVLLARMLATNGIPVLRFDYRGMGDAEGSARSFAGIDDDIAAAIEVFMQTCPQLSAVVIWGLCDAASAALFYAYQDQRVHGLVLLNPWVYTEQGAAKTYLKHYYLQRLLSADLWRKVLTLHFDYRQSLVSLVAMLKKLGQRTKAVDSIDNESRQADKVSENLALPDRMRECLRRFKYPVLLILSGKDLTADEFKEAVNSDAEWQRLLADQRITRHDFIDADHTFSSRVWRDQVAEWTLDWINGLAIK